MFIFEIKAVKRFLFNSSLARLSCMWEDLSNFQLLCVHFLQEINCFGLCIILLGCNRGIGLTFWHAAWLAWNSARVYNISRMRAERVCHRAVFLMWLWQNQALVKPLSAQCYSSPQTCFIQPVRKHPLNTCHISGYFCKWTKLLSWTLYSSYDKQPNFSKLILQSVRKQHVLWGKMRQRHQINFSKRDALLKREVRVSLLEEVDLETKTGRGWRRKWCGHRRGRGCTPFRENLKWKSSEASNWYSHTPSSCYSTNQINNMDYQ